MNEQNISPAGRVQTHFATFFFHIFTLLTCLSITTEFLNDAVWRKGIEWNGVIVGTRMRLKRESFTMGMFSTDVVQNQMPSELVKFQKL